jgi:putative endonuclease
MAEHNELGKLGEEMAVEFLRKTDILFWRQLDFSKAEIDIIAQKKIHLLLLK